jgi:hypothetical protein
MTNPAILAPGAVPASAPELREATIHDSATADREEVRCIVPGKNPDAATDPMQWTPYPGATGLFFPKHGDRALVGFPVDGPPSIVAWWPKAAEPDIPF